ncbi:MAG: ABC transporter permease [Gemmatimonadaceae bacterium]
MDTLIQDFRYALRRLRQNPGFSAVVILTLALGIGANTAIFSVVNGVLLRPLPYRQPENLVTVSHFYPSLDDLDAGFAVPTFRDVGERKRTFQAVAVQQGWGPNVTGEGEPQRLTGQRVTGHWFQVYGVPAALGRTFRPDEAEAGREKVVVLSDGLWKRLYGSDPAVIGKRMQLNGESYEIVGVMPPEFRDFHSRQAEIWAPAVFTPEQYGNDRRTHEFLSFVARLEPGVTVEQAGRDMVAFAEQLKRDHPDSYGDTWTLRTWSLADKGASRIRPALLVLLGAVGFVLLIACANVANLLLARAAARTKEIAIRSALGASRADVIRQLMTESVLLALAGGALGLLLAYAGVRALVALEPENVPRVTELGIDGTVLIFTLVIALVTGLLFGLAPALQSARADLQGTLREGGRSGVSDVTGGMVRRGLVVAEMALALVLLIGAGLLIRSFARLQGVDPGFNPDNVVTANLSLPRAKYADSTAQIAFFDQLLPRLAAIPGVRAAGATSTAPFSGSWSTGSFNIEGYQPPENQPGPWGDIRLVSADFHRTLGIPLLKGRYFEASDRMGSRRVAVVDEEMVRRFWPNTDPIGKRLAFGDPDSANTQWLEVVGVVGHTAHEGLDAERRIQLYLPYTQDGTGFLTLVVRTAGDPSRSVGAIRAAVRAVDPDQPIAQVRTMEEMMDAALGQRRFSMLLLGLFAGLALLLASIGIYGVMSFDVARRSQEIGVRMALGAKPGNVLSLVVRRGMSLTLVGVVVGLVGAFALSRLIASQLFGVAATDPATFAIVALLLATVALAATLVPALRATRVDPVVALRQE